MGAAVLIYGLLTGFVLSGASRNRRENRPNPRMMVWTAQALIAVSVVASAVLLLHALSGAAFDLEV